MAESALTLLQTTTPARISDKVEVKTDVAQHPAFIWLELVPTLRHKPHIKIQLSSLLWWYLNQKMYDCTICSRILKTNQQVKHIIQHNK